jgi:hypothetical protein
MKLKNLNQEKNLHYRMVIYVKSNLVTQIVPLYQSNTNFPSEFTVILQ